MRCTAGALWDVIVDLRQDSPTHLQWFRIELSARNRKALYVPEDVRARISDPGGRDRGFLSDERVLCARIASAGLRYDDPKIGIKWPLPVASISEKDRTWPLLQS